VRLVFLVGLGCVEVIAVGVSQIPPAPSAAPTERFKESGKPAEHTLEPILDAIRKDRASLQANVDRLINWAQAQEEPVASAMDDAREAALRQIREAAASIR
jgi:hypothetical protein